MAHPQRADITFLFAGERPVTRLASIAAGQHPHVEYQEFLSRYGGEMLTFDDLRVSGAGWVQAVHRRAGPLWGMAVLARLDRQQTGAIMTTGEDVGFPLGLVWRLTGGRRPIYITVHGSYLGSTNGAAALSLLRGVPHIHFLCLSEALRSRLIERHRLPAGRVFTVGYGVDTEFFRPPQDADGRLVVSAGTANRDYRTLVAAVRPLDTEVRIAADSAWFRSDTDITGEVLPAHVEARSYGDYPGLRRLYEQARVVVVPLYPAVHACGYAVIAEAMAMGKPVVATRTETPSDFVIEGETGFLVPPGDVTALRERVQYLLERPAVARRLGRNARRLMEERYTLEACNARIARILGIAPVSEEAANESRLAAT